MRISNFILLLLWSVSFSACAQTHPGMILTSDGVAQMRKEKNPPIFEEVLLCYREVVLAMSE